MKLWTSGTMSLRSASLLAALAAALAFANSVGNDFAYDDRLIIAGNEGIQSLESLPGTFAKPYWPNAHGREPGLWRPVTTWVHGLTVAAGLDQAGEHPSRRVAVGQHSSQNR